MSWARILSLTVCRWTPAAAVAAFSSYSPAVLLPTWTDCGCCDGPLSFLFLSSLSLSTRAPLAALSLTHSLTHSLPHDCRSGRCWTWSGTRAKCASRSAIIFTSTSSASSRAHQRLPKSIVIIITGSRAAAVAAAATSDMQQQQEEEEDRGDPQRMVGPTDLTTCVKRLGSRCSKLRAEQTEKTKHMQDVTRAEEKSESLRTAAATTDERLMSRRLIAFPVRAS